MKKEYAGKNIIKRVMEDRAACIFVVTVSVFLCIFTLLEYAALRMEWDIPVLAAVSGDRGFWSEEIEHEELALDGSTKNVLLDEAEALKAGEHAEKEPGGAGSAEPSESSGSSRKETSEKDGSVGAENPESDGGVGGENPETESTHGTAEGEAGEYGDEETALPYYIRINRKQNCITIYTADANGAYTVPYKAMICSTGLYNATPRGTFQLSTKYLWRELYGGVYGQYATRIHGGVLFHSVPYYRKAKNTLCTDKYNKLGQQASMGCVRLTVEDAKWIAENCPEGTEVEIYEDDDPGPLGKPEADKIDMDDPNKGWDPTDPDEDNPWHEWSKDR